MKLKRGTFAAAFLLACLAAAPPPAQPDGKVGWALMISMPDATDNLDSARGPSVDMLNGIEEGHPLAFAGRRVE